MSCNVLIYAFTFQSRLFLLLIAQHISRILHDIDDCLPVDLPDSQEQGGDDRTMTGQDNFCMNYLKAIRTGVLK